MPLVYSFYLLFNVIFLFSCGQNIRKKKIFFFLSLLMIVCIAGFRSEFVGSDSLQYYLAFSELNDMSANDAYHQRYSFGYVALNRLVGCFSMSPYMLFFLIALFTFSAYYFFLKKYSINIFLSIIVFFSFNFAIFLTVGRQAIATSVILFSLSFLFKKRYVVFAFFVGIASLFHPSAIIAILFIVCYKCKISYRTILVFLISSFGLIFLINYLWEIVAMLNISNYFSYQETSFNSSGSSIIVNYIIRVFPGLLCLFLGYEKKRNYSCSENFFLILCLVHVCISNIACFSIIFERLSLYSGIAIPVVSTYFLSSNYLNKETKTLYLLVLLLYSISFFEITQTLRPEWFKITPYSPFWEPYNAYGFSAFEYFIY